MFQENKEQDLKLSVWQIVIEPSQDTVTSWQALLCLQHYSLIVQAGQVDVCFELMWLINLLAPEFGI